MRFFFFFFLFLLPLMEMLLLIKIGGVIGAMNTIVLVVVSGFVGVKVTRYQGVKAILNARTQIVSGELPAVEMLDGIFITMGGLLMILPGFITSAIGALLLLPFVRKIVLHRMLASKNWHIQQSRTYEGEFYEDIEVAATLEEIKIVSDSCVKKH